MGKVMVSMIAGAAATLVATGATWAQPIVITSHRFTFELPGQASQFLEPATQGTVDRNATFTQNLSGAFGGTGTLQTIGTAPRVGRPPQSVGAPKPPSPTPSSSPSKSTTTPRSVFAPR
jgi:hypothetical protein